MQEYSVTLIHLPAPEFPTTASLKLNPEDLIISLY